MSKTALSEILGMFPGLAEAVADASRAKAILDGMPPEFREAMEPSVRSLVRSGKTDDSGKKT